MVHNEVSEEILKFEVGEMQVFPFTLLNHKNRVHSKDYVFLNPLYKIECINLELSKIRKRKDGKLSKILKIVLDKEKLEDLPDLFRPAEYKAEYHYIYSERLVEAINKKGFTNFEFRELEQG